MHTRLLMTGLLCVLAILTFISDPSYPQGSSFQEWKLQHGVQFRTRMEDTYRRIIFNHNLEQILQHNSRADREYEKGVNQFTAYSQKQFEAIFLYQKFDVSEIGVEFEENLYPQEINEEIDWEENKAVTKVKNQGQCNAGWAFTTAGVIEGFRKITEQVLEDLSAQHLVDCSLKDNYGCMGGKVSSALDFAKRVGITLDSSYPYKGIQQKCQDNVRPKFKIDNYGLVHQDCSSLARALLSGPIAVGVDASKWNTYKSGVFACDSNFHINFTVLLVGMKENYWRVKNQWGVTWGENGYMKISRCSSCNTCGICSSAMSLFPM